MKLNQITLPVSQLDRSAAFYERLGLETIVYAAPRYARFAIPGHDATMSIEVMPGSDGDGPGKCHIYFECDDLDARYEELRALGMHFEQPPTDMPYLWREARLRDPDGHDLRLYSAGSNRHFPPWRLSNEQRRELIASQLSDIRPAARGLHCEIASWQGPRARLRALFEQADDSPAQIDRYIEEGEILVAQPQSPIGHLQLVAGSKPDELEIRSLAVLEAHQRRGVGTKLVEAAMRLSRQQGARILTVSTAMSSLGALRFYLGLGFRASTIIRDAFCQANGYGPGIMVDGLPLNDAIVLRLDLEAPGASDKESC